MSVYPKLLNYQAQAQSDSSYASYYNGDLAEAKECRNSLSYYWFANGWAISSDVNDLKLIVEK